MSVRSYNQSCSLAAALDLLGERWTLLVVRQLLAGPKRFQDLLDELPGIGTNLLSERLKRLRDAGLIERNKLDPPAAVHVYELTGFGRRLEEPLFLLARWGRHLLSREGDGRYFHPSYAVVGLQAHFRPDEAAGVDESYQYEIDGEVFHASVCDRTIRSSLGPPEGNPAFVWKSDADTFLGIVTGKTEVRDALRSGALKIEGDLEAFERAGRIFGRGQTFRSEDGGDEDE